MSVKETLARIEQKLEDMEKRQDNWFKLLQERIPQWDESRVHSKFLMKTYMILTGCIVSSLVGVVFALFRSSK